MRPKTPADLDDARHAIAWIDDEELPELESKSKLGASILGMFTWGGGRIFVGDLPRGLGLVGALIAWGIISPSVVCPLVYLLGGAACAVWSHNGARAVNRFVATRSELQLRQGPGPSAYRLLAGAAAVDPGLASALPAMATAQIGPHDALLERLRKLAALRAAGVLHETELRDRKLDILSEMSPGSDSELDDLLFALLPLRDEGVLTQDDFDFIKQIGGK